MHRHIIAMTIGAVLLGAAVYAAFLLRVTLNRTAGEDPSVSAACLSVGDARSEGCLPIVPTTNYVFKTAMVVTPGTAAQLRIRCVDAAGVRHETQYAGKF